MRSCARKVLLILVLPILPAALAAFFHPERLNNQVLVAGEVSFQEIAFPENILWVDARSLSEFEFQHMRGSVMLTEEHWEERLPDFLERWRPGQQVVVYCGSASCAASNGVAQRLRNELGLQEVYVLKGGWENLLEHAAHEELTEGVP